MESINKIEIPIQKKREISSESVIIYLEENNSSLYSSSLLTSLSMWNSFKTKMNNAKDILKFNLIFNWNTSIDTSLDKTLNIFHKTYNAKTEEEQYKRKISSILYFSYRKNFQSILNYKTKQLFTSDCGWGCMIRSSQMILSKALYRLFCYNEKIKLKKNTKLTYDDRLKCRTESLKYFLEIPIGQNDFCVKLIKDYLQQKSLSTENSFKYSVIPPFSIKTICALGEIYNKYAGEWFSDVTMPQIYSAINNTFDIIPNCKIIHFQSIIEHKTIISECFNEVQPSMEYFQEVLTFNNQQYKFEKTGIIFVSVRLGINTISSEYHDAIKELFKCKYCIGIIGGKNSSAYYFIGFNQNHFFYLDPHYAQECTQKINLLTYCVNEVFQLSMNKMQTAFTVGFQFRSLNEFKELIKVFKYESNKVFPIFSFTEQILSVKSNQFIDLNYNNTKDDF